MFILLFTRFRSECENQVKGFSGAVFKKFKTESAAKEFIVGQTVSTKPKRQGNKLGFTQAIDEIQSTVKVDPDEERTRKLEQKFLNLSEIPDENTSSTVKEKTQSEIKFEPPEETTEILCNGTHFNQDAKGFVHVYTDGSCINNGKYTAAAGFGVYFGKNHPLNVSEPIIGRPTNNAGEIQASIRAIHDAQKSGVKRLKIFTDSAFLINSVCKWMPGWKNNGWKLKTGKSVVNQKDFKTLDSLIEKGNMLIKWSYIPAHKGLLGNEEADKLAKIGASQYRTKTERNDDFSDFS